MIIEVTHLTKTQYLQLLDLQSAVSKKDSFNAPIYYHIIRQERPVPCNILAYHGQELIGFASRFLFHQGSVEICLILHPLYHHELLAKKMVYALLPFIPSTYQSFVQITSPHQVRPAIYPEKNWQYLFSCARLKWQGPAKKPKPIPGLSIVKAQNEDFDIFHHITRTCFPQGTEFNAQIYHSLMQNPLVKIYLLKHGEETIGTIQTNQEHQWYRLSDMAILPTYQKSGFGNFLIMSIIHQLQSRQKQICLDIENTNDFLMGWYQRLGMKVMNISDIWKIPFSEIFIK